MSCKTFMEGIKYAPFSMVLSGEKLKVYGLV